MRGSKSPTMTDVAKRARVSVASVSRVLRNDPSVGEQTRQAVEQAIKEVHYDIKATSPQKHNHSRKIALVIPDITNPYFSHLIMGISNIALVQNVEIVLCHSNQDIEVEKAHFERILSNGVQGIIYIPFSAAPNPYLHDLVESKYPIVFLDREVKTNGICSVTSDNEEGAYQATTYLINLGHRDIIFISGPLHLSTSITRRAGFVKGLSEFGIDFRSEMILCGDTTLESGYQETLKLLKSENPFTAIFASNDMMAFGALKALEENGLKVPEDVSVIGYDDIPFASYLSLTTIAQPSYEIGRNALLLLLDLILKLREPPEKIVLRDSLIIRKSCRKI